MRIRGASVLVPVAMWLAAIDCSSDSEEDGPGIQLSELCGIFVADVCTALIDCAEWDYCNFDHCLADQECMGIAALEAEVELGWVVYDPLAAEACHQRFAAAPCEFGFFFSVPTVQAVLARCEGVVVGQQGEGAPCASVDCVAGLECVSDGVCPGTCMPFVAEGGACVVGSGPRCDPQLDLECREGVCVGPWKLGEACSALADCGPDLWCDRTAGQCAARASAGQPCDNFGAAAPTCGADLWCDSRFEVGVCQPPSGTGGPCLDDTNCQEGFTCLPTGTTPTDPGTCGSAVGTGASCDSFDDCEGDAYCATDTCAPYPAEGQACDTVGCATDLLCIGGTCVRAVCPGEACNDSEQCVHGICAGGVCATRARLGAGCGSDDECASRACPDGACIDDSCMP